MSTTIYLTIVVACSVVYYATWIVVLELIGGPETLAPPLHLSLLYFIPSGSAVLGSLLLVRISDAGILRAFRWTAVIVGAAVAPLVGLQFVAAMACALLEKCL